MSASEYNEEELVPPAWINKEFFQEVLSNAEKVDVSAVTINDINIQPAAKKYDHSCSLMFRAHLKYQLCSAEIQTKSLIIKAMPEMAGQLLDSLKDTDKFDKEIFMYSEVIPRFERALRDVGDNTILAVKCLYTSLTPRKLLVFEDLVSQGYTVPTNSMTLPQVKCAYNKLAKFHAISYKINMETPEYFDKFYQGIMNTDNLEENNFFQNGIRCFVELLESTPTLQKYKSYFESIQENLVEDCKQIFSEYRDNPQPDTYYVLCHGDFHLLNLMEKPNADENKEDIILLDFQTCIRGSLAIDLIYSFYQLVDAKLTAHIDELIKYYFDIFTQTLLKFGFKGTMPKFVLFRAQIFQRRKWEMFLLSTFFPIWGGFRKEEVDTDLLLTSKDYSRSVYKNDDLIAELEVILKSHEELGYFYENL